ncbi:MULTISPECIES: AAA family ATPase [unclassified Thioalkalivibrio]|uniref:AAA family ATPase n=1 Tax=unclassified Thioalkalivibrio TaxID=2621013 RepID=UPI0003652586|nr:MULTISPECIES: AAA family ATPase [unclassified Thioalkalivibrio]PYG02789.1 SpoVK/Ycf46/Vps4 family AAA+-type ATPase [Thioalkalivibrio sp. ALE21]
MAAKRNPTVERILRGLHSRYPIIYLQGWDEDRIERLLQQVARKYYGEEGRLQVWSAARGFAALEEDPSGGPAVEAEPAVHDPEAALTRIAGHRDPPRMSLFKDLPVWFDQRPGLVRGLRDLYYELKGTSNVVFVSCPQLHLPDIIKKEIFLVDVDLPTEEELLEFLEGRRGAEAHSRELLFRLAAGMRGLSLNEAGHLASRLLRMQDVDEDTLLREVQEEKGQILRKESVLQFYPPQRSLEDIGGLGVLKEWVTTRADLFSEKAYEEGVPLPAGVLFMGVSGCGKSMAAKAIAAAWDLPLARLDMSLVLSGSFGTPEYAFARATRIADEIAPVVLWIDELENAFGFDSTGSGGNVNIFSSFLTWLQEKSPRVFVAATANRIELMPAELMRKGRFDQLFFLDLPNADERREILELHIRHHGGDPDQFDMGYLTATTKEWSGAEIEQLVRSARIEAYREGRTFNQKDIIRAAISTVPLSKTMVEQIRELRNWSFKRAVNASKSESKKKPAGS